MNQLVLFTLIVGGVSLVSTVTPVNAQTNPCTIGNVAHYDDFGNFLNCQPARTDAPVVTLTAEDAIYQGKILPSDSKSSESWLQWQMNLQDGTISGTTQRIRATFEEFPAYDPRPLFSFAPQQQQLRTLLDAEITGFTDLSQIGSKYCFDSPRWNFRQEVAVNGITYIIPKQLFGTESFDTSTQVLKGWGIKFTPEFVERLLKEKGVFLRSGDNVIWKVSVDNRFTLWDGKVTGTPDGCLVTGASAFDASVVDMKVQMHFIWFNPLEEILRPTTTLPDLDGDGIPDSTDLCDFTPERYNGFQDTDGCPDDNPVGFVSLTTDLDGDGIVDGDDLCPSQPENFNTIQDGDGCPDGAILESGFRSTVRSEPIISLSPETEGQVSTSFFFRDVRSLFNTTGTSPTSVDAIDPLEDNPQTEFLVVSEPTGGGGKTSVCDNAVANCNQVIANAIQEAVQTGGIKLPFAPTVLNLVILIGAITAVLFIILRAMKKI